MKLRMLAGAAVVAAFIATPAMARSQEKFAGPQQHSVDRTGTKKTTITKTHKLHARHLRESNAAIAPRGSGFAPLDVAAGVAGGAAAVAAGAANTASAAVTAPFTPFRGDSYTYYRDTSTIPNRGYLADGNGPRCLPGQMTTINGQRMMCQ